MSKLGNTIKNRRLQVGLTQQQAAAKSQTQQSQWSKIESGQMTNIGLDVLGRIAKVLNVDPAELLLG